MVIERIINNIRYLMSKKGITNVTELARLTKIHQPTLHRLLAGDVRDPRYLNLKQLANYFNVNVDELAERDLTTTSMSVNVKFLSVPIVGNAQLGDGGFWTNMDYPVGIGDGYIQWPTTDKDAYALKCKGDSMTPRIKNGEYVVVEPNHQYTSGDEVLVVTKDSKVMVKTYLYCRGGIATFMSINEDHPTIKIEESNIESIHYVAGIAKESLRYE